jgi:HD-like signal output (HDOD) protein
VKNRPITCLRAVQVAERLPSAPYVLTELQQLLADPNNGVEEVSALLRQDAGLTARVVRIANGIVFNRGGSVGSLEAALGRIGFNEVHRLAGAAVLRQLASMDFAFYPISTFAFCRNSLAVAFVMEELSGYAELDSRVAYTTGLLRSIGKLILDTTARAEYRTDQVVPLGHEDLLAWEQCSFGIAHPEVAVAVLRAWRFPAEAFMPIRDHFLHHLPVEPHVSCRVLNLACGWVDDFGWGLPGERAFWEPAAKTKEELRISRGQHDEIVERAATQTRRFLEALDESEQGPAYSAAGI